MPKASKQTILAVDFDHTIADVTHFPIIDGLRPNAKKYINQLFDEGFFIIVNTCRSGLHQKQAEDFLIKEGVKFHLINENHPDLISFYKVDCRKISCDFYIDDKNLCTVLNPDLHDWHEIYQNIHRLVGRDCYTSQLSGLKPLPTI